MGKQLPSGKIAASKWEESFSVGRELASEPVETLLPSGKRAFSAGRQLPSGKRASQWQESSPVSQWKRYFLVGRELSSGKAAP